ncbi:CASP-like protein 4A4 isoform X4 [Salvia miltiorrhiza]|uniref:CASP-like protein 4A4 isoform X4 n=1 Tax=Salvia miltiorrhiza TaxID=226208 RepID=UPI0025AB68D8|nr:CASP-like protein 4A4 isoform X4 [Salvia miltiorrhiza]
MSGVTVSPVAAAYSPAQPPLPTPSPFSFSVASTRWSSRPPVQTASILLRYCFNANILTAIYSAYQIFKNICDYAQTCIFISDTASDYISFIFDQVAGYVLISASSVAVPLIQQMEVGTSLRNASVVSVCFSFASFLVTALAAFLSGYKLCKRIMW